MLDLVIIGAGPAGLFAGTNAAMQHISACIIESSFEVGGQLTLYRDKAIYDLPGLSKIQSGLFIENLYEQYAQFKEQIPLYLNTQAIGLEAIDGGFKLLTNQGPILAKTILLANGGGMFAPRELDVSGVEGQENIKYSIDNINNYHHKKILILGGGDSAVDWTAALGLFSDVTLTHRRNDFRAHEKTLEEAKKNAKFMTPYQPIEVIGAPRIKQVLLRHTESKAVETVDVDEVLVFYGTNPVKNKQEIWQVDLENNAIKVGTNMETSRPGIYAVGNGVFYEGKLKMIVTALGEAATAIGSIGKKLYPNKTRGYVNR